MLDYILSLYLITGSEHNGDALPKNYKFLTAENHPDVGNCSSYTNAVQ